MHNRYNFAPLKRKLRLMKSGIIIQTGLFNMLIKVCIPVMVIVNISCDRFSKYPGYSSAGKDIYFQLHKIGEGEQEVAPGDYVTAELNYITMQDSVFFNAVRKFQITEPEFPGSVDECFLMLGKEDCATFIIDAEKFFIRTLQSSLPAFIDPGSSMKIKIEVFDIQAEAEYERQKQAFLSWIEDFDDYEKTILQQYLLDNKYPDEPLASGLYCINIIPGKGKQVEQGDTVTVHYEGRFLDGSLFDSTVKRNQPFNFVYGTEWQLIKGLEEAIGIMHEGEKSVFIIPSEKAFGREGSSSGIIPPFTPVIFEVEIVKLSS